LAGPRIFFSGCNNWEKKIVTNNTDVSREISPLRSQINVGSGRNKKTENTA